MDLQTLHEQQDKLMQSNTNKLATAALFTKSIRDVASNPNIRINPNFTHILDKEALIVIDQESTGTCWIQAGLSYISYKTKKTFD